MQTRLDKDGRLEPCVNCGGSDFKYIYSVEPHQAFLVADHHVESCAGCELWRLFPVPTHEQLSRAYGQLRKADSPTDPLPPANDTVTRIWHKLTHRMPALGEIDRGPVLDLGCNYGELLEALTRAGIEAHGLEMDEQAIESARSRGLNVAYAEIGPSLELEPNRYSTFVLSHVLEHLRDPVGTLRCIRSSASTDALIIIVVPNRQSIARTIFGPGWHGWGPPFHLTHFDPLNLRRMLERSGWEVIKLRTPGDSEDITRSLDLMHGARRRLLTRAALIPVMAPFGWIGRGSYIIVTGRAR